MRAGGGCTVQQALTFEAASVVKQAVALARRRGHAQVTPLHVASTMLSASDSLLRTACLQSHSQPLQCKALELCFNVALNRLQASTSTSPMLAVPLPPNPIISNALVAAFKRAQAHQRRGSIENQPQPVLAVRIEIEQLIISILDDPSVSRVMREAGFSSPQVKNKIEQVVSLELSSPQAAPLATTHNFKENDLLGLSQPSTENTYKTSKTLVSDPTEDEDVSSVLEGLMKRRSIVVVGECLVNLENVIRRLRDKFDKGDFPKELMEMKFINIPFSSFNHLQNLEVNEKIEELGKMVRDVCGKGVVLYIGDLKQWMIDYRGINSHGDQVSGRSRYRPVQHVIAELGKLVCGVGENAKCWLLGIATFATYTRCRSSHHLLETCWGFHSITLPAGNLGLSLSTESVTVSESKSHKGEKGSCEPLLDKVGEAQLSCCADCSEKFEAEARIMQKGISNSDSTVSCLPSWLKDESIRLEHNHKNCPLVGEPCRKWNSVCSSIHKETTKSVEKSSAFFSAAASPSSSVSVFSYDQQFQNSSPPNSCGDLQYPFWAPVSNDRTRETTSKLQDPMLILSPFSSSTPNSCSPSSDIMEIDHYVPRFKEFNWENLKILCNELEQKVPWRKDIIPEIAATILQCRSGMLRRKNKPTNEEALCAKASSHIKTASGDTKEETWLLFHGTDSRGKERIARELAKVVFGSYSDFISIALSCFSSTRADSNEANFQHKRCRDEKNSSYIGKIAQAISENPHRVILVEDLEQADLCSQVGIKRAIERGKISNSSIGEEVRLSDAIIILCCEGFSSRSRACSPPSVKWTSEKKGATGDESENVIPLVNLDLNMSFDDEKVWEDPSVVNDMGITESVDGLIVFRQQEQQ